MFGARGLAHEWNEPTPVIRAPMTCPECRRRTPANGSALCGPCQTAAVHAIGREVKGYRGAERTRVQVPRAWKPTLPPAPVQESLL